MNEFRVRKSGEFFWVWQLETGRRYIRVQTPFATRREALAWVAAAQSHRPFEEPDQAEDESSRVGDV